MLGRLLPECPDFKKNSSLSDEIPSCLYLDTHTSICCLEDCCFKTRRKKDIWQNWYLWFVIIILLLLVLTAFLSYISGLFKKKHHNLIRVRHVSAHQNNSQPIITAITGSDGYIQPSIRVQASRHQENQKFHASTVKHLASPLSPPYTPIKPVTIIRGSAPPMGYRQTSTYTELVLPPGYIQTRNSIASKPVA